MSLTPFAIVNKERVISARARADEDEGETSTHRRPRPLFHLYPEQLGMEKSTPPPLNFLLSISPSLLLDIGFHP
ncbi:hypothetical protein SESBI_29672 [Sesbania bispinosa]|nr:hypothetical protein SESBI_29672 [Sesbania bispinosa]